MNLSENYKRFFGQSLKETSRKSHKITLTEHQNAKLVAINRYFKKQYPTSHITIRNNNICVNGVIVENAITLLDKSESAIINKLKSYANKSIL